MENEELLKQMGLAILRTNDMITKALDHIETLSAQIIKLENRIDSNESKINDLQQMNIATHMDITGIDTDKVPSSTKELTALVTTTLKDCKVKCASQAIVRCYKREVTIRNTKKTVIGVVFKDLEAKLAVINEKKRIKHPGNIYFDNTLTPRNRQLLSASRIHARKNGMKAFFSSGKVFISSASQPPIHIASTHDLNTFRLDCLSSAIQSSPSPLSIVDQKPH